MVGAGERTVTRTRGRSGCMRGSGTVGTAGRAGAGSAAPGWVALESAAVGEGQARGLHPDHTAAGRAGCDRRRVAAGASAMTPPPLPADVLLRAETVLLGGLDLERLDHLNGAVPWGVGHRAGTPQRRAVVASSGMELPSHSGHGLATSAEPLQVHGNRSHRERRTNSPRTRRAPCLHPLAMTRRWRPGKRRRWPPGRQTAAAPSHSAEVWPAGHLPVGGRTPRRSEPRHRTPRTHLKSSATSRPGATT